MIPISEQFLSIQGEGSTAGHRAVFLRTHACNLLCGAGKYKSGSRWTCDSIPVFSKIQNNWAPEELLNEWNTRGWVSDLESGAHLVITGGEPLMPERQSQLIPFLNLLPRNIYIEVETNGTHIPQPEIAQLAQEYGFNFCSRLHILLYDQTTGV